MSRSSRLSSVRSARWLVPRKALQRLKKYQSLKCCSMPSYIFWVQPSWERIVWCCSIFKSINSCGFAPKSRSSKLQMVKWSEISRCWSLTSVKRASFSWYHTRFRPFACLREMIWFYQMNKRRTSSTDIITTTSSIMNFSSWVKLANPSWTRFSLCGPMIIDRRSKLAWACGRTIC